MTVDLSLIVDYLDTYLDIRRIPDNPRAQNGLQVENAGTVSRIAAAVDACQAVIDAAAEDGADLLLVHHGLFWSGEARIVGRHGQRIRTLLEHGIAVYGAHIPLDYHREIGNNAVLARDLGLTDTEWIGDYDGVSICVRGRVECSRDAFVRQVADRLKISPRVIATGPEQVRDVAIVTGAGSALLSEARDAGVDTFLTGEGPHHTYFDAEEWGMNLIYAGHYATETVGVQALAAHLNAKFGLPWRFIDHPTGM